MIKLTYFDTSILQALIDNPLAWLNFNSWTIKELNKMQPLESIYLFFEYFGFDKKSLEIPANLQKADFSHLKFPKERQKAQKARDRKLPEFRDEIIKLYEALEQHIGTKLESNKDTLKGLVNSRLVEKNMSREVWKKTLHFVKASAEHNNIFLKQNHVEDLLFKKFIDLYENDFPEFVKYASSRLAWDALCSITPEGISHDDVREILCGIWRDHYERHDITLPVGKPAIGLRHYYQMTEQPKNYPMKNHEDMVDSEMYTLLILGHKIDNEIKPINIITLESPDVARARMKIVSGNIVNIEDVLKKHFPKFPGKIYCVDENLNLIDFLEPQIPIRL